MSFYIVLGNKRNDFYACAFRVSYLEIYNDNIHDLLSTLPENLSTAISTSPLKNNLAISEVCIN